MPTVEITESPDDSPRAEAPAWPPRCTPFTIANLLVRFESLIRNGTLIWLRDIDERQTLRAAVKNKKDELIVYRWWPNYIPLVLNDDGSVTSVAPKRAPYTRHWIAADQTNKIYMLVKNSETYLHLDED
jgi:hypothetical protein